MSGADEGYEVTVTFKGEHVPLKSPVFWDWDDDDESQIRLTLYVKNLHC